MKAKIIRSHSRHGLSIGEIIEVVRYNDKYYFTTISSKWRVYIKNTDLEIIKEAKIC